MTSFSFSQFFPFSGRLLPDASMNDVTQICCCLPQQVKRELSEKVKNIAMEILDFYDSHKMISEERINAAMNKLPFRP
ncbi:hypothetical protein RHGRI_002700 [Rhododendron griersonianum]|uniref:Uncharacterized protein n=1 Tax=Rhododendron griersonianum TaxID=479676 RepID=A0AAV6LQH2_9ERIC|nr:hypothetical protein RHGRI_002700 [Rhododendron griersonianum]